MALCADLAKVLKRYSDRAVAQDLSRELDAYNVDPSHMALSVGSPNHLTDVNSASDASSALHPSTSPTPLAAHPPASIPSGSATNPEMAEEFEARDDMPTVQPSISTPPKNQGFDTEESRAALADVLASLQSLRIHRNRLNIEKQLLGSGGFGTVRRATWHGQSSVGSPVLGTFTLPNLSPFAWLCESLWVMLIASTSQRFARELKMWSTLEDSHTLPCLGFDIDIENGLAYFVSPYMPGGSIRTRLDSVDVVTRQRNQWVIDVAAGLKYLHSLSPPVAHGDLKAANFLLDTHDIAVLCDFGLSSVVEDSLHTGLTTSDVFTGSIKWCSPELFNNGKRTTPSDTRALALSILEIMTSRLPFYTEQNDFAVMRRILMNRYPTREEYPELPPDSPLWELVDKCIVEDPTKRPSIEDCWSIVSSLVVDT